MSAVRFVDVFSEQPFLGNALAVFHDAAEMTDEEMLAVARWTNLSETAFLLPPSDPRADYAVRIWTTGGELPFAGHPTLGSAHAWLEAGGVPRGDGVVVQECGAGLVEVHRDGERVAFVAPPLVRSGPVEGETLGRVVAAMGLDPADVVSAAWVDNGPGWCGILLRSPEAVLAAAPDPTRAAGMKVGLAAPYAGGARDDGVGLEVRAFYSDGRRGRSGPGGRGHADDRRGQRRHLTPPVDAPLRRPRRCPGQAPGAGAPPACRGGACSPPRTPHP